MDKLPNTTGWQASLGFEALVITTKNFAFVTDIDTGKTDMVPLKALDDIDENPADVIANRMANDAITDMIIEGLLNDPDAWETDSDCPYCGL